ncbi:MAG: ABC transporter substrate-binding protein [Erythrobacter sp.]
MIRSLPALALLLVGCAGGDETAQASQDEAVVAVERPTIVSLNPCTDAILAEVTAPGQLLAISHYSNDPQASSMDAAIAAKFQSTGGTVEEVLALDPDVVVAGSFLAPVTRAGFADAGIRVVTFGIADSVATSEAQIRELAELAGDKAAGEELVGRVEEALGKAAPGDAQVRTAVLWQPGGIVPGENALVSELMERAGFASHTVFRGLGQADYLALEEVLADPPDVLLVAGGEAGQGHPVLDKLPNMRREAFDTSLIYCGGPTIIRAIERLAQIRRSLS